MEGRSVLCFCFHRRVWSEHALYFLPCYRQRSQCLGTRFTDIKAGCMASVSPYRLQHGKHWFGAGSKAVSLQQCLHDWSQWFLACFGGSMVLERQQPCSTQEGQTGRSNRKCHLLWWPSFVMWLQSRSWNLNLRFTSSDIQASL